MAEMIEQRTWNEFRAFGLLWWVNRSLHLLGWAIVVDVAEDGTVTNAYPARVRFRGFDSASEEGGFIAVTAYMKEEASALLEEAKE